MINHILELPRPLNRNKAIVLILVLIFLAWPATGATEPRKLTLVAEFGGPGTESGQFDTPWGVAVDHEDRIIVADTFNNRIQICNRSGICTAFGKQGSQPGEFFSPADIAVDKQNRIFVADMDNDRMQVCNHQGACISIGGLGTGLGRFDSPIAVAANSDDHLVIADQFNNRVQTCDVQGNCGSLGTRMLPPFDNIADDEFGFVGGVAIDMRDRILLTENIGGPVRKTLRMCDRECSVVKIFDAPGRVAVDRHNRIHVVEKGEIHKCDHAGRCEILVLEGASSSAWAIAFTHSNELVVSNPNENKIRIYANAAPFQINAGLNDAWFNPITAGQGFFINVFPDVGQMFMAWFTYDIERPDTSTPSSLGEAGHRWITAQGSYADNQAVLDVWVTEGGIFDSSEPAPKLKQDGEITVEFSNCNAGTLTYDIASIERQGIVPIERIALDNVPLCEALEEQVQSQQ